MADNLRDRIARAAQRHAESSSRLGENTEPAVSKTENLRDRIAAVIHDYSVPIPMAKLVADAVIAELGLKRMEMGEWDVLAQGFRGFRYVTPWDVDDE